ncbi:exported protein of unknown function [Hyphomicrobium sp. MC1]|nr:exported protein of unknown function [Hyphomicrobium sp. MC1]
MSSCQLRMAGPSPFAVAWLAACAVQTLIAKRWAVFQKRPHFIGFLCTGELSPGHFASKSRWDLVFRRTFCVRS